MIVAADLHLGDTTDSIEVDGVSSKILDTIARLYELITDAMQQGQTLVLAGDIFDSSRPTPQVLRLFMECLHHASTLQVNVVILPGNHDSSLHWTTLIAVEGLRLSNVQFIYEPRHLVIDETKCFILPHLPKTIEKKVFESEKLPLGDYTSLIRKAFKTSKFEVLISHAQLQNCSTSTECEMEAGNAISLQSNTLPKIPFLILGHVHKPQEIKISETSHALIPGSLTPHSFGEIDDQKSYILFTKEVFEIVAYSTHLLYEYKQLKINMSRKTTFDISDDKLKAATHNKLLKVKVITNDRKQVDIPSLRERISTFGTILRFEIEEIKITKERTTSAPAVHKELDHVALLHSNLEHVQQNQKIPSSTLKLAFRIGKEIIQSCCTR
jgi:DNA repair exonuclease SbcCD nuclease subunit